MFYRQHKTFLYHFCNLKHFLKAENSEDSLAGSCAEKYTGSSCNPVVTGLLLELGSIVSFIHHISSCSFMCFIYVFQKYGDRLWPLIIFGSLMFIPGSYHVYLAVNVFLGTPGYSFDDIPEFD